MIYKNPNKEELKMINDAIAQCDGYCCCALEHTADTKCMCKEFRESKKTDFCHCGRYYKVTDYPIATICGNPSLITTDRLSQILAELSNKGIMLFIPPKFYEPIPTLLDDMTKAMIDKSKTVYVISDKTKLDQATVDEIEWATRLNKEIVYLEEKE